MGPIYGIYRTLTTELQPGMQTLNKFDLLHVLRPNLNPLLKLVIYYFL